MRCNHSGLWLCEAFGGAKSSRNALWVTAIHGKTKRASSTPTIYVMQIICLCYKAPEILQFQKYDAKADLWSVGTILYEMVRQKVCTVSAILRSFFVCAALQLVGRPPFNGANHIELLATIERSELRVPPTTQISENALHLLQVSVLSFPNTKTCSIFMERNGAACSRCF